MSLTLLLRRALAEHAAQDAIYDLPARKWYTGDGSVDTSVRFHGEKAATPLGPAAGPQSQLAQNIILSWLGGSRIIELKTVQVKDDLVIERPCIDATNVGYNIEWSQELKVDQSLTEYAKAWLLLYMLRETGITDALWKARPETLFDLSVGYDLAGIRSDKVTRFIRGMMDAGDVIDALRKELPADLAKLADIEVPSAMSNCVTLSTFHGCPADEIESICNHLLNDVGTHVVIKMNPTLLGYERVCAILNNTLGFNDIAPIEEEFDNDLQWDQAIAMVGRLRKVAADNGLTLGAKFTNTLVVRNHRKFFPNEDRMYMSGQPLFPISLSLALKFREAVGADLPISFSAGIDAKNFVDAVSCGLTPITTCTDLLRPGGYGRLFKYMQNLEKAMAKLGVTTIDDFITTRAGVSDRDEASLTNMRAVVDKVLEEKRYTQAKNAAVPRKIGSQLVLFDCINCDKCIPVCPNDANFVYEVDAVSSFSEEAFVHSDGSIKRRTSIPFVVEREHQIGNYADFCNDCGNCDVFCPEDGGPFVEKPRFFGSLATFREYAKHGGFFIEASDDLIRAWARIDGADYELRVERSSGAAIFSDGTLELSLAARGAVIEGMRAADKASPEPGHVLSTHPARTMLTIVDGVLNAERPNYVNASLNR